MAASSAAGSTAAGGNGNAGQQVSEEDAKAIRDLARTLRDKRDIVDLLSPPFLCSGCREQNGWQPHLGNTVRIKLPDDLLHSFGAEITVHARRTDTIDDVKARVSAVLGVPVEQLRLRHDSVHGMQPLHSAATLQSGGVQDLDTLRLTFVDDVPPPPAESATGAWGVESAPPEEEDEWEEVASTRPRRGARVVPPPACVVRVELPPSLRVAHSASLPIATKAKATVRDVKATLDIALGVKAERQTLYCQTSSTAAPDQPLSDGTTLKGPATLQLSEWGGTLCVEDAEHSVGGNWPPTCTIGAVKARLIDKLGVPAEALTLSYDGRRLPEQATLQLQRVPDNGVLTVDWDLSTLRLSLPGDSEADAARCTWVESQRGVNSFRRLAAARAQCAGCNERTGPLVSDGVPGSATQGCYGKKGAKLARDYTNELHFRFGCKACSGGVSVRRSARLLDGTLPKRADADASRPNHRR